MSREADDVIEAAADRVADLCLAEGMPQTPETFRLWMRAAAHAGVTEFLRSDIELSRASPGLAA
ncbi:MAG TPA: hypothetical protein PK308_00240 [Phycisphaerales bacterium]|nr:hypothetical protein [Phycisphaerales bacterium]